MGCATGGTIVIIQVALGMECVGILEHELGRGEREEKREEATRTGMWTLDVEVLTAKAG